LRILSLSLFAVLIAAIPALAASATIRGGPLRRNAWRALPVVRVWARELVSIIASRALIETEINYCCQEDDGYD